MKAVVLLFALIAYARLAVNPLATSMATLEIKGLLSLVMRVTADAAWLRAIKSVIPKFDESTLVGVTLIGTGH